MLKRTTASSTSTRCVGTAHAFLVFTISGLTQLILGISFFFSSSFIFFQGENANVFVCTSLFFFITYVDDVFLSQAFFPSCISMVCVFVCESRRARLSNCISSVGIQQKKRNLMYTGYIIIIVTPHQIHLYLQIYFHFNVMQKRRRDC